MFHLSLMHAEGKEKVSCLKPVKGVNVVGMWAAESVRYISRRVGRWWMRKLRMDGSRSRIGLGESRGCM